jgi:hypothetical protein
MSDTPYESNGLMVAEPSESVSTSQLADLGFIMPIATPQLLRAAFAEKQRLYAAILDESDYIYSVSYVESGRARQAIYARRADAEKAAKTYMTEYRASPKKSGVVKLAAALGIESTRVVSRGLPEDPNATYSYVTYKATHKRTGRSEEGIGWCDNKERPKLHDIIATADTRAYNRAVLRLAGFGDVSADEIVAGASTDDHPQTVVIESNAKKAAELPETTSPEVMRAMKAWWEAEVGVARAPAAQQASLVARELRSKARRGDEAAARNLASRGFTWDGPASDGIGYEHYQVEAPIPMLRETTKADEVPAEPPKPEEPKKGWNLSGLGSEHDDILPGQPVPTTRERASSGVPSADAGADFITTIQAKRLSETLLTKFKTKEAAREWLQKNASCDRSVNVRANQYESIMSKLEKEV